MVKYLFCCWVYRFLDDDVGEIFMVYIVKKFESVIIGGEIM